MKAVILSDSHGDIQSITDIINSEDNIDLIVFAGDVHRDAEHILKSYPQIPFVYVLGNNDWFVQDVPYDRIFAFGGKWIFLTHGHQYHVKDSLDYLWRKVNDLGAEICVFGHTHVAHCKEKDGVLMLNPGSTVNSYMVLDAAYGKVNVELKQRP